MKLIIDRMFRFFCVFLLFSSASVAFAQNSVYKNRTVEIPKKPDYINDEFYLMRLSKAAFNVGNYGEALKQSEYAREYRRARVKWELYTLNNSLQPLEVKRAGDEISEIMEVLITREDSDAIEIITRYQKNPRSKNEALYASRLLKFIGTFTEFPEADFMLGNIYHVEGDYALAKNYYDIAWNNRKLLDVPDEQYSILYRLAELSYMQADEKSYEEYLTAIVRDDNYFKNSNLQNSLLHFISKRSNVDTFFNAFRPSNFFMMDAYTKLSEIYRQNEKDDEAIYMAALAALTGFTRLYSVVESRAPDYFYEGLEGFFERVVAYSDLTAWALKNGLWQSFYNFAELAKQSGYDAFADQLTKIMDGVMANVVARN